MFLLSLSVQWCTAQNLSVRVDLKDGNSAEGKLLKISAEGVELRPSALVASRFIPAERILKVEILETHKTIHFPLEEREIPPEALEIRAVPEESHQPRGKARFVCTGSFGYAVPNGTYYKGFNDGTGIRIGADIYYFGLVDPTASRFMLGFSFTRITFAGEKILGLTPSLIVNEYSLEIGRSTAWIEGGHYAYFKMGIVVVSNDVKLSVQNLSASSIDSKTAIRFEAAASFRIVSSFSLVPTLLYDLVVARGSSSNIYASTDGMNAIANNVGGILQFTLGVSYDP